MLDVHLNAEETNEKSLKIDFMNVLTYDFYNSTIMRRSVFYRHEGDNNYQPFSI